MHVLASFTISQTAAWAAVAAAYKGARRLSALLATASALAILASLNTPAWQTSWLPFIGATIALYLDAAAALVALVSLPAVLLPLIHGWISGTGRRVSDAAALACYASILGLAFSWSVVVFYIYWELLLIASTVLIAAWNRRLAISYFVYMQLGSLLLLVAVGVLLANNVATFSQRLHVDMLAAVLLVVAFAVKLGVVPFHTWLPRVYTTLPEHVAAIVSGAVTGAGAYGLYRFSIYIPPDVAVKMFWMGAISAAIGALAALASNKLAEIAAYSSIGHSGFTLAGILCGGYAAAGALYLMAGHAIVKPLYFLVSDVVRRRSGQDDIRRLGLLARTMPLTAFAGFVAALSLAGAPAFALFPGELATVVGVARTAGLNSAGMLATAAFLSACYAARFWLRVFWHPPAMPAYKLPREPPAKMVAPLIALAVIALSIGVVGGLVIPYLIPYQ